MHGAQTLSSGYLWKSAVKVEESDAPFVTSGWQMNA